MKNILFLFLLSPLFFFAQEETEETNETSYEDFYENFKQWHLEFGVGFANNARAHDGAPGIFPVPVDANGNAITSNSSNPFSGYQIRAGLRYSFTETLGIRLKGAYHIFSEDADASTFSYNSSYLQFSLEGVINGGAMLNLQNWSQRLGLQMYAGMGFGFHIADDTWTDNGWDQTWNLTVGFTPMYRLSENLTLTMDVQFMTIHGMENNWSGRTQVTTRSIDGLMYNASIGLNIALGQGDEDIDWMHLYNKDETEMKAMRNKLDELEDKIAEVEGKIPAVLLDDDNNGVPNIYQTYIDKGDINNGAPTVIKTLVSQGYYDIFFDFDEDIPEVASVPDIDALIIFMKNNPNENIELVGYTDVLGSDAYNDNLSVRRATFVNKIMTSVGIDQSRIEYRGSGVNPDYTDKDEFIRNLARRVRVILK